MLALSRSPYKSLNSSVPILLDEVLCLGDELGLSQCHHRDWGLHDCSHYEDAGVICQGIFYISFILLLVVIGFSLSMH